MTDPDWNLLLDRYVAGECSQAEIVALEQLLGTPAPTANEMRTLLSVLRMERLRGDTAWKTLDRPAALSAAPVGEELERATARMTREIAARGARFEIGDPRGTPRSPAGAGSNCTFSAWAAASTTVTHGDA